VATFFAGGYDAAIDDCFSADTTLGVACRGAWARGAGGAAVIPPRPRQIHMS
jgi:hypothetical protein